MKKKIWIPIVIITVVLLAVLFVPIPQASYDDGGTSVYTALTYKIVDWNRLTEDGVYEKTRFYFGKDKNKSIDELWELEYEYVEQTFLATIVEMNETSVVVIPVAGEVELNSSNQISFNTTNLKNIGAMVGSVVEVTYTGGIMESYPAQIHAIDWKLSGNMRHMEFTEEWLSKETAKQYDHNIFSDIVITRIYSNCFLQKRLSLCLMKLN